ncbi:hypothetical protein PRIPAC_73812 [Pristionchus pacificus]|uniref:Zinc finger protein n=1 Tax=Pristionchus pacificus TaxID=54126 RepID=A0A2A6D057_PRIPA|nr:hypothetical protein PRIPAC_73812 [Pristionchus pacificus]|eukprot:PDM83862.1 zinc finger protein [Pristionchus pacificus]
MDTVSMDRVNHWKNKAYEFTSSDRMGFMIYRAMELMGIVIKDGTTAKNLQYFVRSLDNERKMAIGDDDERSVPLREMVYGLCETFEITIKSILDERSQPQSNAATGKEKKAKSCEASFEENVAAAVETPLTGRVDQLFVPRIPSPLVTPKEEEQPEIIIRDETVVKEELIEEPMNNSLNDGSQPDFMRNFFNSIPSSSSIRNRNQFDPTAPRETLTMDSSPSTSFSSSFRRQFDSSLLSHGNLPIDSPSTIDRVVMHECDECGKKFTTKKSMETHKVVHTGKRNHVCPQCGWEFMRRSDLLRHLKTVDHSKPVKCAKDKRKFECEMCGTPFYRLADKSNHIKIMHKEMYTM